MTNINVRLEENVKTEAEKVFDELGLSMSAAINVFLRQAIRERGIPFEVKLGEPNEITLKAINEAEILLQDDKTKGCKNSQELKKMLGV